MRQMVRSRASESMPRAWRVCGACRRRAASAHFARSPRCASPLCCLPRWLWLQGGCLPLLHHSLQQALVHIFKPATLLASPRRLRHLPCLVVSARATVPALFPLLSLGVLHEKVSEVGLKRGGEMGRAWQMTRRAGSSPLGRPAHFAARELAGRPACQHEQAAPCTFSTFLRSVFLKRAPPEIELHVQAQW